MKNKIFAILLLFILSGFQPLLAVTTTFEVNPKDVYKGCVIEKIWLTDYVLPKVTISDITYMTNVSLPKEAQLSDPSRFDMFLGMERKRPFVIVRIPVYTAGSQEGQVNMVSGFTLSYEEVPAAVTDKKNAAKSTYASTSVLATGTWYKIGVTQTGFFKIDHSFIASLGVSPSTINPANIRIFGNGGRMLAEDNNAFRTSDLIENAIIVNGNNDAVFDNGEWAAFFASGPTGWNKDSVNQRFVHVKNLYTDTAYYFITFDNGPGLRVAQQAPVAGSNVNVTSFNYYDVHDTDAINPGGLGKLWYGEQFSTLIGTSRTFPFNIGAPTTCTHCRVSFGATSAVGGCNYVVSLNDSNVAGGNFANPTSSDYVMNLHTSNGSGACGASAVNVRVTFNPVDGSGMGYLNYIELNTRRSLVMTSDQMNFRDWQSVGAGNIASYQLAGANSNTIVWDVTNPQVPVAMPGTLSGGVFTFTQNANMLHEFAAMNSTNLFTPKFVGKINNQNLHGLPQADLLIVTYPGFLSEAQRLADYHRNHDGMRVNVATTTEIYNEFSSGGQDISAIRDFACMFYKRAGTDTSQLPKWLLLFGGASYDYKDRLANNSNFVPVFESAESTNGINSFSSDDFYAFLDDNENIENTSIFNVMDVGVGRLPARNTDDATNMVDKIIHYSSPATLGPWRISATVVGDKGCKGGGVYDPAGNHMQDGEDMATEVSQSGNNLYNIEKVYVDAMPLTSTPAGTRCPAANAAINQQVFKGTLWINYNGHGNPQVLSGERIVTQDDYNNWSNEDKLPFMVTATCDYGQFDHPQFVSAGEQLVLRRNAGVIAILTTTQAVYAIYNHAINTQYLDEQFTPFANGNWKTFGDAYRSGKNATFAASHDYGEIANFRKFSLLGDPAVTPNFPKHKIFIDSITDGYTKLTTDTVKALGEYIINGSVRDNNGNTLTGFNGMVTVSFYDKPRTITTISGCDDKYRIQNNIIYKGRVSVTNGLFSLTFITPKDINYYFGSGKVSTYAENGVTDAAGADSTKRVGGFSDHPVISSEPPVVKPYINDSLFLNGGITGSNTSLFVSLFSKTGINVSGNVIGHDLTAVLDEKLDAPYILNDYYETAPNTYQRGYVSFPISGLADGRHTITVKAWDVNNNSGEGTVDFIVVDGKVMNIQQLMNYPNPFTNTTNFVFEHNHPGEELTVQLGIYSTSGMLVKNIQEVFTPSGSRSNEISWDGTDMNGTRLPSGVYVYKLNISTDKGFRSTAYQKLVIVR